MLIFVYADSFYPLQGILYCMKIYSVLQSKLKSCRKNRFLWSTTKFMQNAPRIWCFFSTPKKLLQPQNYNTAAIFTKTTFFMQ